MALNDNAKNAMLDHFGTLAGFLSAHTADPGSTGASEVTGGTYGRVAVTWNAAAAANLDSSNQPVLNIPGGTTVTHLGLWSASTAGTFYGGLDIVDETFAGDGTYTASDVDVNLT